MVTDSPNLISIINPLLLCIKLFLRYSIIFGGVASTGHDFKDILLSNFTKAAAATCDLFPFGFYPSLQHNGGDLSPALAAF
jgi:hypothetical protein